MSSRMTMDSVRKGMEQVKLGVLENAARFNELDAALGDGDLGVTLSRAVERFSDVPEAEDLGTLFMSYARCFSSTGGSTYGTLMATGLMSAAKATKQLTEVPWTEVSILLGGAGAAMAARGKAELGDKTVLDVIEAARKATEGLSNPEQIASAAVVAVDEALTTFRGKPFQRGRARIFGEKGIGMDDPGMVAFRCLVASAGNVA